MAANTQSSVKSAQASKTSDGKAAKAAVKNVEKAAKEKVERIEFPSVGSEDPKLYPFSMRDVDGKKIATPMGFDNKKHIPLRRKDFVSAEAYFTYRAEGAEAQATHFRTRAADEAKLGSGKERGVAKKLLAMQAKMAELTQLLKAQGMDVTALLAQASADAAKAEEPAEAAKA